MTWIPYISKRRNSLTTGNHDTKLLRDFTKKIGKLVVGLLIIIMTYVSSGVVIANSIHVLLLSFVYEIIIENFISISRFLTKLKELPCK